MFPECGSQPTGPREEAEMVIEDLRMDVPIHMAPACLMGTVVLSRAASTYGPCVSGGLDDEGTEGF